MTPWSIALGDCRYEDRVGTRLAEFTLVLISWGFWGWLRRRARS